MFFFGSIQFLSESWILITHKGNPHILIYVIYIWSQMLTETSLMTYSITMQLGVESPDWWGQLHHLRGASGWGTASKVKRCSSSFILVISHEMSWMWWKLPIDAIDHSWHHEPAKCFGRYCVYPEYFVGKSSQKHPNFQGSEEQWDHYDLPRARGY